MTRHSGGGGLAAHVADRLDREEAEAFIEALIDEPRLQNALIDIVELMDQPWLRMASEARHLTFTLEKIREVLRRSELRDLLASDTDARSPDVAKCRMCGLSLTPRKPGARGRPRVFCGAPCRQTAYRRRNGQHARKYWGLDYLVHDFVILAEKMGENLSRFGTDDESYSGSGALPASSPGGLDLGVGDLVDEQDVDLSGVGGGVPKAFAHDLDGDAGVDELRGVGMAQLIDVNFDAFLRAIPDPLMREMIRTCGLREGRTFPDDLSVRSLDHAGAPTPVGKVRPCLR